MRPSKLLAPTLMAMLALTAITTTTATAETLPNILPLGEATHPLEAQGTSGQTKFGSGLEVIESSSSTSKESGTSEKSGTFHVTFLGSKSPVLGQCQGTGDEAGTNLSLGQFHIRDAKEGATLITVIIFLLEQVHLSCGGVPVLVEGCAAGKISSSTELASSAAVSLKVKSGDDEIVTVLNEENTKEEACRLLSSVNGGATVLSSVEQTATIEHPEKEGKAVQALVMPL